MNGSDLLSKIGNVEAMKQKKDIFDYIKLFFRSLNGMLPKIKSVDENIHLKQIITEKTQRIVSVVCKDLLQIHYVTIKVI